MPCGATSLNATILKVGQGINFAFSSLTCWVNCHPLLAKKIIWYSDRLNVSKARFKPFFFFFYQNIVENHVIIFMLPVYMCNLPKIVFVWFYFGLLNFTI